MKTINVQINPKIVIFTLVGIGLAWLAIQLKQVFLVLFIAFIMNAAFRPLVDKLEKRKIPRFASILIIYLTVFALIVLILGVITGELINQVRNLVESFPQIYARFAQFITERFPFIASVVELQDFQSDINSVVERLSQADFVKNFLSAQGLPTVGRAAGVLGSIFGIVITGFTTIMVSVYMLSRKDKVQEGVISFLPKEKTELFRRVLSQVEASLGSWVVGQSILMLVIGVVTYFVVLIPGFIFPDYQLDKFALPIALLAGLLEALPNIGPIITTIIAGVIALGTGGVGTLVYVILSFLAIQNLESVFLVPQVMRKAVGIDPILTILGIIGAFEVGGPIAAVLIVPIIATVQIALKEWLEETHKKSKVTQEADLA